MATDTLYNISFTSPTQITREEYTNVGSGDLILGDVQRGFKGSTDFEIWTAALGGTQLTENTDYELIDQDIKYSSDAGFSVYTGYKITNATYQTGSIFVTYKIIGSYTDADLINSILTTLNSLGAEPIGTIKDWDKSYPSTPSLSSNYVECDGAVISDASSVYDGYRSRNLNNESIAFSVTWASGVATIASTDVTALLVGQSVSGGAIAAGAYIDDITGTTVTMSDTSYSGTLSTTFTETSGGRYLRGASTSGVGSLDAMQRITGSWQPDAAVGVHEDSIVSGAFSLDTELIVNRLDSTATDSGYALLFDSNDSTSPNHAKTNDAETSVLDMTVVKIMKIK